MRKNLINIFITIFTYLVLPLNVFASGASLEFKHKSFENEIITTEIYLNTGGSTVNALTADFTYPVKLLKVIEIDSTDSIFSSFVEKDYSNDGIVKISCFKIEGVNGSGNVATVKFKVLGEGEANLEFTSDAAVMDATTIENILTESAPGVYTINKNLDILPKTGIEENSITITALIALIVLVMIISLAIAGFTMWGGIYLSLGKWKVEGKYEVGLGKGKKRDNEKTLKQGKIAKK